MKYLINHKRFKKNISSTNKNYSFLNFSRIFDYPHNHDSYFNFFTNYAKDNYTKKKNSCLCSNDNDILNSLVDRHNVEFEIVTCQECGLIRAKYIYLSENYKDLYTNNYRHLANVEITPEKLYEQQYISGKPRADLIRKFSKTKIDENTLVADYGGGCGGILGHFKPSNNLFLIDFSEPHLELARKKNINTINGAEDIEKKFDIVILSHVVEHWHDFNFQIERIKKLQKVNSTINYIEFPAIDSLKEGRRFGDLLGDIHIPHVYYFSKHVFENLMNRYGFKQLYADNHSRSIYIYTGEKKELKNYFYKVKEELLLAEKRRRFELFKKIIRVILPNRLIIFLRKVLN